MTRFLSIRSKHHSILFYGSGMYRKHPNHTYGRNRNNSANKRDNNISFDEISLDKIFINKKYFEKNFYQEDFKKISLKNNSLKNISLTNISMKKISFEKIFYKKISFERICFEKILIFSEYILDKSKKVRRANLITTVFLML